MTSLNEEWYLLLIGLETDCIILDDMYNHLESSQLASLKKKIQVHFICYQSCCNVVDQKSFWLSTDSIYFPLSIAVGLQWPLSVML